MIQDTTLRMVVRAVDEATQPLEDVKKSLDEVSGGLDGVQKTAGDALPAVGKAANEVAEDFSTLGRSAGTTSMLLGPAMAEAIAVGAIALTALISYIRDVNEEHERLRDLSTSLNLPVDVVKGYSDAWLDVAKSLNEAARGYKALSDAQAAALAGVGLSPGDQRGAATTRTAVALGKGTDLEKIDVLRRLFGIGSDQAAIDIIKEENRKFFAEIGNGVLGVSPAIVERVLKGDASGVAPELAQRIREAQNSSGLGFGQLNVNQLLNSGKLPSPVEFKAQQKTLSEDQREAERAIADINRAVAQEQAKAARQAEQDKKARDRAALDAMRDKADAEAGILQQGYKSELALDKATNQAIIEGDKEVAAASKDAWKLINDDTAASLRQMVVPVNEFVESWKDAMKDMVYFGDFSFKRLVARIIVNLTSKELFSAIDKVGDALENAFNKSSSGGGGILSAVGSFVGSLFGGKAGGGQAQGWALVGEDGPELAYFGAGGRVMNQRQLAFAGAGQGGGTVTHVTNHYNYSISGVETQQVVAYIERTRREDQKANVKMLERNGLGRMR